MPPSHLWINFCPSAFQCYYFLFYFTHKGENLRNAEICMHPRLGQGGKEAKLNQNRIKHMVFSSKYYEYRNAKKCVATDIATFSSSGLLFWSSAFTTKASMLFLSVMSYVFVEQFSAVKEALFLSCNTIQLMLSSVFSS